MKNWRRSGNKFSKSKKNIQNAFKRSKIVFRIPKISRKRQRTRQNSLRKSWKSSKRSTVFEEKKKKSKVRDGGAAFR